MNINFNVKIIRWFNFMVLVLLIFIFVACKDSSIEDKAYINGNHGISSENSTNKPKENEKSDKSNLINLEGKTIKERFNPLEGFERVSVEKGSFGEYLRNLPLKSYDSPVLYYDGREKTKQDVYTAVIDMEIGGRDLQQCADAVMRLKAEYLFENKRYDEIKFHFVNGFLCDYNKWRQGYRVAFNENNTSWVKKATPSDNYESFRKYLDIVFSYASTLSLEKELIPVEKSKMKIGDVFIQGGSPGHAVIVVDMAENKNTGEKLFMLAQSYMPAQETQILVNPNNKKISPWYSTNYEEQLQTPEWSFDADMLRTW